MLSQNANPSLSEMAPTTPASDVGDSSMLDTASHDDSEFLEPLFIRSGPQGDDSQAHQYPLASQETPSFLRSFQFHVGGSDAVFREFPLVSAGQSSREGALITAFPLGSTDVAKIPPASNMNPPSLPTPALGLKRDAQHLDENTSNKRFRDSSGTSDTPHTTLTVTTDMPAPLLQSTSPVQEGSAITPDELSSVVDMAQNALVSANTVSLPSPSVSPITGARGAKPLAAIPVSVSTPAAVSALVRSIPTVIESFDDMPGPVRHYVLYNLLRRCDRRSLSFMSGIIAPALRCDLLAVLPAELSNKILGYLDVKTLCNAAQVSSTWHAIVDEAEWIWKDLLDRDELNLTDEDVERAEHENWGYTGWGPSPSSSSSTPPINIYKAIYRRKFLIRRNWMDSNSKPKHLAVLGHGTDVVTCLQFDDDQIITGSDDRTINVYDTRTGELKRRFEGHEGGVWALKYINKNTLISGSTDRTVRVWDIEKARCTHVFYGHTSTVRCLDTVEPVKRVDPVTNQVSYMPPYPIIITGSRDSTLRMWRLPGPDDAPYLPQSAVEGTFTDPYFLRSLRGHTNSVRALSGYEDTVVSGSYDTTVRVWKISTGQCLWELTGHAQRVYSAVLDHKRNRCISGSMDWLVKVWSIETGSLLYTLEGHTSLVGLLDLNRTTLVSAAADSTLRVWDPETGASIHKLEGHQGAITCFQHDENKVVSGSDPILKLWNIRSGKLVRDLLTNLSRIWQVCFDERRCVAAVKRDNDTYIEILDFDYDPYGEKNEERTITSASVERVKEVTQLSATASSSASLGSSSADSSTE